jgi:hypothetical protein
MTTVLRSNQGMGNLAGVPASMSLIDHSEERVLTTRSPHRQKLQPVRRQSELDAALDAGEVPMIVGPGLFVLTGDSVAHARSGTIDARDDAGVFAEGGAAVRACDRARVWAQGRAHVDAYDQSVVVARGRSCVRAADRSQVIAHGLARITVLDRAVVWAHTELTTSDGQPSR